jgi:pilus assembly protein CpaB
MKGSRALIMLLVALVAGAAAVVLAARWLTQQTVTVTETVVVAARDINLGTALNASMLEVVPWPAGALPTGAYRNLAELDGRVLMTSVQRGEPMLESRLAPVGTRGGLSAVIPQGKRAITVRVNEVVGVAGFALPGNYVDVMVNTQDDLERLVSKIVLERILVLAVAQEASRDDTKPRVVNAVTLEVSPEEAERIDLARSVGTLSLVLRNQIDQNTAATTGITKRELLGAPPEPVVAAPAPAPAPRPRIVRQAPRQQPDTVEVIRGVDRSTANF